MEVNSVIKTSQPIEGVSRQKITMADILEVKKAHIERNLLYSPEEAGQILGKSARTVIDLVKDGKLLAANESAAIGRKATSGIRISAESLEIYRKSIMVDPEIWSK